MTALVFAEQEMLSATAPSGAGFSLRGRRPELQRLLLHALERFPVEGGFYVPRERASVLAGVTEYHLSHGMLFIPLEVPDAIEGLLAIETDELPGAAELRHLRGFADIAAWSLHQERTAKAAQREAKQSTLLALINERMRKSLDRAQILNAVVEDVRHAFGAATCVIYGRDPARPEHALVLASAGTGIGDDSELPGPVELGDSEIGRAFEGSTVRHDGGAGPGIVVPFFSDGRVESALALHFTRPYSFDDVDLVMLRSIAFHVGLALSNVRLFELERMRRARAELIERVVRILRDTQYVDEVLLVFAVTTSHELPVACAVYGIENGTAERKAMRVRKAGDFEPVSAVDVTTIEDALRRDETIAGESLPLAIRERLFGENEGLAIPLQIDGNLWGMIAFYVTERPSYWDDEARQFFRSLCVHLELSLTTALGFERIQQLARALRESSEFKDDLLAMLAHDYKGPLTVVLGYCDLLLETLPAEFHGEIETIYAQTQRLVRLSEDALALAQTQAGGFSLDRAAVDLTEFVEEHIAALNRGSARIRVESGEAPISIWLDPQRFAHVLENLLQNALKYSTGEVLVRLARDGDRATIEVTDRGIGIPEAEIATVFARFGRATNARRKGIGGSGVGLYVARKIVEVHGGTISVVSKENEGSTFTISLPVQP
ncbi:MAG: ATP-binding protein [Firmicutes bacterium]|nr:ATP-binding protein [Bacillota bacterium]